MRRDGGRRVLYTQGYLAALTMARADLHAMSASFQRDYAALLEEVEVLRREIAQLRVLAGIRDPAQPLN
jgi:hypothetical protein